MGFKEFMQKVDPFAGRMFGADKDDKKKFAPKQQYWGGSKETSDRNRAQYEQGVTNAGYTVKAGLDRSNNAANRADEGYSRLEGNAKLEQAKANQRADQERAGAYGNADKMTGVADGAMAEDRGRLLNMADNASADYQRTADAQLRASQDSNQRQALAQGSRGGASGLRAAMAGSLNANQQAGTQAQIVNAQEQNEIMNMRSNMYGQAAGISNAQAGVYGQAAGLYSNREDAARNQALAQQGVQGNAIGGRYGAQSNAGQLEAQVGMGTRGQYLNAQAAQNNGELNASREYEGQRQANEKYNYTQDWFPLKRFNAPA